MVQRRREFGWKLLAVLVLGSWLTSAARSAVRVGWQGQGEASKSESAGAGSDPQGGQSKGPATQDRDIEIPSDSAPGQRIELTLDSALRLASRNNSGLLAQELLQAQQRQSLRGARAIFEPELFGNFSLSRSESPPRNVFQPELTRKTLGGQLGVRQLVPTGGQFEASFSPSRLQQTTSVAGFPDRLYSSEFTVSLTQPLLRGAWTDYTNRQIAIQASQVAAAESRYEQSRQDLLRRVVDAYWELVFARENFRVVTLGLELATAQEARTRERIRVGELAPLDIVADQSEVARRREELVTAETEIRGRQDALRRLLYDDSDGRLWSRQLIPVTPIGEFPKSFTLDWRDPARRALRERADLRALRADIGVAETQLMAAERDILPRLDLVSSYSSDSTGPLFDPSVEQTFGLEFPDWSVRLELSIPIGNTAARAERDSARLEVERRRRLLYDAELEIFLAVRDAVRALEQLAESIQRGQESVRLESTNLNREIAKRDVGSSTTFDVQQVTQQLLEARQRLLRNQLDYRRAEQQLRYVQGVLRAPEPGADTGVSGDQGGAEQPEASSGR